MQNVHSIAAGAAVRVHIVLYAVPSAPQIKKGPLEKGGKTQSLLLQIELARPRWAPMSSKHLPSQGSTVTGASLGAVSEWRKTCLQFIMAD